MPFSNGMKKLSAKKYFIKKVSRISWAIALTNFKTKASKTYLGILWYLIEPIALFVILLTVHATGNAFGTASLGESYPIYLITGLIMFNFFASTTKICASSVLANKSLLKTTLNPKEVLVFAPIIQNTLTHFFEIAILAGVIALSGFPIAFLAWYALIFPIFFVFTLGFGFFIATIGSLSKDISKIWDIITRIIFFATPIFYLTTKKGIIGQISSINPLYYFIESTRSALLKGFIHLPDFYPAIFAAIICIIVGFGIFSIAKKNFAELV